LRHWSVNENQFTEDGLYYRHWPTNSNTTKATVLLVHGLGEHCERYNPLATALNNAGYALCSMDLPGHGQSEGDRGHINLFSDFQDAALKLHAKVKKWYPEKPIFLLGCSMGGLISARLLLDHQHLFKGALLTAAAIQSPQAPPKWQTIIITLIAKILPKLPILALDASCVSRDPNVVEKYMSDPLINKDKLSAGFLTQMLVAMNECKDRASEINLPIRIMHGSADVMTATAGSELLHRQVSSNDKELKIYEGLYHEIFNEPEAESIYAEVIAWLDRH